MGKDSAPRLLLVAFAVCFVCSVIVSSAAVFLRERQEENRALFRKVAILRAARLYDPFRPVKEQFRRVTPRLLDLSAGWFAPPGVIPSGDRDQPIPPEKDLAGIRKRPRYREIYLVKSGKRVDQVILPVEGKGLWSTMYGFISLGSDLSTVTGFGFYQHGETPGLGGEVDNPRWLSLWPGKRVFDMQGNLRIEVIKGSVDPASPGAIHQVDGLSGATLTTRGVHSLLRWWLGDEGYAPFLSRLRMKGGIVDGQ